jgi:3-(3-hydroxy-phenyl)propionate hydroxylase
MSCHRCFAYRRSRDQDAAAPARHPVVVIGAGPVGLTLAIDLARRGLPVVLLDDADRIGEGSRAICFAKKTREIFGRHGLAARMLEKGLT